MFCPIDRPRAKSHMLHFRRQCPPDGPHGDAGQATVEAAITTLFFFGIIILLVQPTIWLYTRMVMGSAAGETARVVATRTPDMSERAIGLYALRRLQAVPPVSYFRVDDGSEMEGWKVDLAGGPDAEWATVTISCKQQPMPFLGLIANVAGMTGTDGLMTMRVSASVPAKDPKAGTYKDWGGGW